MSDRDRDGDAKEHLKEGLSHMWKAAQKAASGIRSELNTSTVVKKLDDAGRELARAANNVADRIGEEISHFDPTVDKGDQTSGLRGDPADIPKADTEQWPSTAEEYQKKYGATGDDWPHTREEYERRYGPHVRIANPDDIDAAKDEPRKDR